MHCKSVGGLQPPEKHGCLARILAKDGVTGAEDALRCSVWTINEAQKCARRLVRQYRNIEFCLLMQDDFTDCAKEAALELQDRNLCTQMEFGFDRNTCLYEIAIQTGDVDACTDIMHFSGIHRQCLQKFPYTLPWLQLVYPFLIPHVVLGLVLLCALCFRAPRLRWIIGIIVGIGMGLFTILVQSVISPDSNTEFIPLIIGLPTWGLQMLIAMTAFDNFLSPFAAFMSTTPFWGLFIGLLLRKTKSSAILAILLLCGGIGFTGFFIALLGAAAG